MAELKALQDRIASLVHNSDTLSGGCRHLMNSEEVDALSAMQREIDETQLLRQLVFRNDTDEMIELHVSSGRVLRVSEATSYHLLAGGEELVAQDLFESDQQQVSSLIAILRNFTSATKTLCVESHILQAKSEIPNVGIPAQKLFRAFAYAAAAPETLKGPACLKAFAENCSSIATAILSLEDNETSFEFGPDQHLKSLRKLAATERAARSEDASNDCREECHGHCIVLTGHPENGHSILWASVSHSLVLVMFESEELDKVYDIWASLREMTKID